jgi:hypothetical protein
MWEFGKLTDVTWAKFPFIHPFVKPQTHTKKVNKKGGF